jgi:hypothetical protein
MVENSRTVVPAESRRGPREWLPSAAYVFFAGGLVLLAARLFYSSLKLQLFYSSVRGDPLLLPAEWSAPLDDVFIHFDFARSAARGHPFEWSAGNGYSSGGTSLLYPLILSPGFWFGFAGPGLMHYAAVVACTCVFGTLLVSRRLFRPLPGWTAFLAPPFLLGVGALDWSLFSGMEVAFFLAVWALCFTVWDDFFSDGVTEPDARRGALLLGAANAALVATRPEAIIVALVFAGSAAFTVRRRGGRRTGYVTFGLAMAFACAVLVGQAVANRLLTGDWSAAGAVVKLEMNDPRLSLREVLDAWLFHVRYQVGRVTGYHLADGLAWGSPFWILPALPLCFEKTRQRALLLWSQAVLWVCIVALNGQVRWQNERYTMPALAWILLCAALGVGTVLSHGFAWARRPRVARAGASGAVAALVVVLGVHQVPKMRDQLWFFGRASRNIHEQHIKVGRKIRREMQTVRRVLVGDAGAIPYASDFPALDIIGLGGYPELPFARASRWGVAAAIELIQRIPDDERPDVMAIYPGWWGDMPAWFGTPVDGVSVRGNVICGGLTKMIYRAHWEALDAGNLPSSFSPDTETVVDEMDFGDLLSEAAHGYRISGAPGFVAMKLLSASAAGKSAQVDDGDAGSEYPEAPRAAMDAPRTSGAPAIWDAGRVVPPGASVTFTVAGFDSGRAARLVVRTAPSQPGELGVRIDDTPLPNVQLRPGDSWYEAGIDVPERRVRKKMTITITVLGNEMVLYHLWGLEQK